EPDPVAHKRPAAVQAVALAGLGGRGHLVVLATGVVGVPAVGRVFFRTKVDRLGRGVRKRHFFVRIEVSATTAFPVRGGGVLVVLLAHGCILILSWSRAMQGEIEKLGREAI